MSKYFFQVERAGIHTTFQDLGRFNVQHLGICPGGSMDSDLLKISNKLVNNVLNEGVLDSIETRFINRKMIKIDSSGR